MRIITELNATQDVALVNLSRVPAGSGFVSRVFNAMTEMGVNVDMIAQTALTGPYVALNFTASGEDIGKIMEITARIQDKYPTVKPLVSTNNVKISLFGEQMPEHAGIAAGVFGVFAECEADILLITTSSVDISVLVEGSAAEDCIAALKKKFEL